MQSIIVKTFTFNLSDSTITPTLNKINFKGYPVDVKRQIDSTIKMNSLRNSNKEAWIKSWGQ